MSLFAARGARRALIASGIDGRRCVTGDHNAAPPTPIVAIPCNGRCQPIGLDSMQAVSHQGGFLLSLREEIPAMVRSGGGAIVNTSAAGLGGVVGLCRHVATKHAIENLQKVAALDYAAAGVRINALAPGPILTDNLKRAGAAEQEAAAGAMPLQRVGQPDEVDGAVVWLCSDQAGFITGMTLTIDGGKFAGTPPFHVKAGPR